MMEAKVVKTKPNERAAAVQRNGVGQAAVHLELTSYPSRMTASEKAAVRSLSFSEDTLPNGGSDVNSRQSNKARPDAIQSNFKKKLIRRLSSVPYAGKSSSMAAFDCIERPLSLLFYKYGRLLARQPLLFIALPLLLTAALSIGLFHATIVSDAVYLFTPKNALSKYERQVIHDKWPLHSNNYVPGRAVTQARECQVVVKARDGGNILLKPYSEAVRRLQLFIRTRIFVTHAGKNYYYGDLCLQWKDTGCVYNKQVQAVSRAFNEGKNISFPKLVYFGQTVYLGSSMGGVALRDGGDSGYHVASSRAWLMLYSLRFQPDNDSFISGLWEREFERQLLNYPYDPYVDFTIFHSQTLTEELKRNAETLTPRFVLAFSILIFFSVLCLLTTLRRQFFVDWVVSKPTLAVFGVLNAGMGVVSAIGLLNFIGMPFNDIVSVMPFLVVSIGVDNMFLMVAALRRTNRLLPVDKRVAECLSDAAISITITALTDALSFGVGAITPIPAVQIFCVYTSVAIIITFVYQLTFFTGLLVLYAKLEQRGRHCVVLTRTKPAVRKEETETGGEKYNCMTSLFLLGSRPNPDPAKSSENYSVPLMSRFFKDWYAPVLMQPVVRVVVLVWLVLYLLLAAYGCFQLREGLEPINLLVADSYAIPHYNRLENYFWGYGPQTQVVFNNLPDDLANVDERTKIKSVVAALANTKYTIPESVIFWLEALERYVEEDLPPAFDLNNDFYSLTRNFFSMNTFETWQEDIRWDDPVNRTRIAAFRCFVGLKNFRKTNDQRNTMNTMREVARRYPRYNITTFMPLWLFTDQYQLILPNTLQNIGIALFFMVIIALLLIPQPVCALWVAVAIASIDIGVIGYMTLWGVNLDAISMITIIMSIGFAVDFSAHVTYGYVISDETRPAERVKMALGALGWPISQGALSTVLGVCVLANVEAYMITTFFKTVFLVITLGALHGLVFLPVMLSIFVRGVCVVGSAGDEPPSSSSPRGTKAASIVLAPITTPPVELNEGDEEPFRPAGRYGIFLPRLSQEGPPPQLVWRQRSLPAGVFLPSSSSMLPFHAAEPAAAAYVVGGPPQATVYRQQRAGF